MPTADEPPILLPIVLDRFEDPGFDPEFATRARRNPAPRRVLLPQEYQRLVVNPFLALAGLIAWIGLFPRVLAFPTPLLAIGAGVSVVGIVFLLHYHCRDCGRTGWLFKWTQHACAAVEDRQRAGRVRRLRGPSPMLQLTLWIFLLAALLFLTFIAYWGRNL